MRGQLWMGAICASPVEELEVADSPVLGVDEEPLWRQVADAQIARRKEVQAPLIDHGAPESHRKNLENR